MQYIIISVILLIIITSAHLYLWWQNRNCFFIHMKDNSFRINDIITSGKEDLLVIDVWDDIVKVKVINNGERKNN